MVTDTRKSGPTPPNVDVETLTARPTLVGADIRLVPLGPQHFEGTWEMVNDPEGRRLTGTHAVFTEDGIREWLNTRAGHRDRSDWALESHDGTYLGEVVLNDLDVDNASIGFRISMIASARGHGYGTQATRMVVDHAFAAGIHRIALEVFDFNPRARRVYEKCGFIAEGIARDALWWAGDWHSAIVMAVLSNRR